MREKIAAVLPLRSKDVKIVKVTRDIAAQEDQYTCGIGTAGWGAAWQHTRLQGGEEEEKIPR